MYDFIESIWKEKYRPAENCAFKVKELDRAERVLEKKEEELYAMLGDKGISLYEEICDILLEISELQKETAYINGARFVFSLIKDLI